MKYRLIPTIILIVALLAASCPVSVCYAASECYAFEVVPEESLDSVKLLGTILESEHANSFAVIKNINSEKQGVYQIGNQISGYQIAKISRGEVVLLRNGKTSFLNFPLGSEVEAIVTVSENKIIVNRNAVAKKIPDINTALQQAVLIPFIEAGKVTGIKITHIKDKSLVLKAGIKEGDIVISVNDWKIDSMQKAAKIAHEISTQDKIDIVVMRGNDIKNLTYYLN